NRRELQKGPVALVGFRYQILRLAEAGVRPQGVHPSADDYSGIKAPGGEDGRDHGSRSGLAVPTSDGNAALQAHEPAQHLSTWDHWYMQAAGFSHFGVVDGYRRTGDHYVRSGDVRGSMAIVDRGAQRCQPLGDGRGLHIGAGDLVAKIQQDFGNPTHPDSADADEVDTLDLGKHEG